MEDIDWKKRAEFYKKQLDDLKVNRFDLQNELKKKDLEIANERRMRQNHYRKMTEFRHEVTLLLKKKLCVWD